MPGFVFIKNRLRSRLCKPDSNRTGRRSGFYGTGRVFFIFLFQLLISINSLVGQTAGDYRTNGNTQFNLATNWQVFDGTAWVAASVDPSLGSGVITIRNGHTATVATSETLDQLIVEAGGTLRINNSRNLNLGNGAEL